MRVIDIIAKVLGIVLTILQIVKTLTENRINNPTRNGERKAPQSRDFIQRYYSISLSRYEKIFERVVSGIPFGASRIPNL